MGSKKKKPIPVFESPIVETHCHLDYLKDLPLNEIVEKSKSVGIEKIITISVSPDNLNTVTEIASSHEDIYCTQGVHPHQAKMWDNNTESIINENLKSCSKIVALGEMGLDYHYSKSPHDTQRDIFEKQLQMAVDNNLPVVIHTRDADEDTQAILKNFSNTLKGNGVIHSFTSSKELAQFCLNEGFMIGINGIITFKNAEDVRKVLDIVPLDRILLETDAPFLTPVPYRGRENAPFYLPFIGEFIADFKGQEVNSFLKQVRENTKNLFGI